VAVVNGAIRSGVQSPEGRMTPEDDTLSSSPRAGIIEVSIIKMIAAIKAVQ
jgi:hypothetical protein